jgi:hypothetical protein
MYTDEDAQDPFARFPTYGFRCALYTGQVPAEAFAPIRVDESNEYWRKEKVSYRAAYGDERIPAFLYLPRNARPPYQAVLWAPGGYA